MKPHLCYATEIRSPAQKSLKFEVEQVLKPVTRWILSLKTGQMSYGERLLVLDMHAASYLLWRNQGSHFLSHIQYYYTDIDITYYVTFNVRSTAASLLAVILTVPACETFQALFFVRIAKLWNKICNVGLFT